jgi:hypothetical protein
MLFFVAVLASSAYCWCAFVVKNPLSVAVPRPLHQSCTLPARYVATRRLNGARRRHHVRHQFGAFLTLRAPSLSVSSFPLHDMHIFNVNKCTYVYSQPLPFTLWQPTKTLPMWLPPIRCR